MCGGSGSRQDLVDSGNSKKAKCDQSGVNEAEGIGRGGCLGRETMPALAAVMRTWLVCERQDIGGFKQGLDVVTFFFFF